MTTFYNNYPEKPDRSNSDIYIKVFLFGILGAIAFIFLGHTIKFIIKQLIKYWVWALVIAAGLFFAKKFFSKKGKKKDTTPPPQEEYYEYPTR